MTNNINNAPLPRPVKFQVVSLDTGKPALEEPANTREEATRAAFKLRAEGLGPCEVRAVTV